MNEPNIEEKKQDLLAQIGREGVMAPPVLMAQYMGLCFVSLGASLDALKVAVDKNAEKSNRLTRYIFWLSVIMAIGAGATVVQVGRSVFHLW